MTKWALAIQNAIHPHQHRLSALLQTGAVTSIADGVAGWLERRQSACVYVATSTEVIAAKNVTGAQAVAIVRAVTDRR